MATIITRKVKGNEYYYLSYSYRDGKKVLKEEKYLGPDLPEFDDLVKIWEEFSYEIVKKRYFSKLEKILDAYRKIVNKTPKDIFLKNLRNFGIRFTHHSNKIEGSSLSLRDVKAVVDNEPLPPNKRVDDVIEAKAHMNVYKEMIDTKSELSMDLICEWHRKLFRLTKYDIAGFIRDYPVGIEGSNYEPPISKIEIEMLLEDLFEWYEDKKKRYHPVFLAAVMHYRFIAIHPFGDGNGRMTRLMTCYILHKNGYPMFDIDPKIRRQYYNALEKADKKEDNELPFILWFFKHYIMDNKRYLATP
ncbi:MAG: Fic family protein [Promethearchaeota archaeon]|nr:MAG: Fic family protein [Candidatus Lokiarchaeota archaeon]